MKAGGNMLGLPSWVEDAADCLQRSGSVCCLLSGPYSSDRMTASEV